jgi:hypothetical protein
MEASFASIHPRHSGLDTTQFQFLTILLYQRMNMPQAVYWGGVGSQAYLKLRCTSAVIGF